MWKITLPHVFHSSINLTAVALPVLKVGLHDSAHVHESKYCFSPMHAVASAQASSFNCIVNEPIGGELIART